ncbi:beta-ketoacyl synthase domain-containing protein [Colletotrichum graminicola M1.001]|uniref:Beta-ketoacyl synthase domain-containing protein n=1 Tax=Colletotrichum graminicola (strain M1.001 / M2 / FGSC 10212) TaxID=645133 RepID=E3R122_COLGM|nr:beta-ketoacyl synthase domain-containing protein [Colletotrichum graminicola M1.001]EFQ36810.1 beta-ketoacyl synthase domain-containing protein [Colletotrichum graminicola M1.001]
MYKNQGPDISLYLFGDQTFDIAEQFKDLLRYRNNPLVENFLEKSYQLMRKELYLLPSAVREGLPRFTCIEDFVLLGPQNIGKCNALELALTCIYQIGTFIRRNDLGSYNDGECRVIGLCTGALSAAAVSCSTSPLDLICTGIIAVKTAFRIGLKVTEVAGRLAASDHQHQNWSLIVSGIGISEIINEFCHETSLSAASRPYISAYMEKSMTLSGPPPVLKQFIKYASSSGLRFAPISVYAPYHAPHLYSSTNVAEIVNSLMPDELALRREIVPVLSSTGSQVHGGTFRSILEAATAQILLEPISWSHMLNQLQTCLAEVRPKSFTVFSTGSHMDETIYAALNKTEWRYLTPVNVAQTESARAQSFEPQNGTNKAKLAIIGMSGRFPGAKHNEAFWDVLRQGLDLHKPAPALHWDVKTHVDPTGKIKNTSATPFGCWLDDPGAFDAKFFNISPREAAQIDPAQRLALMTAYEAIEQAGIIPDATPSTRRDRVGVFYGVTSNDWMETNSAQNIDTYFIPGGNRAFIPGRINYCFKFSGPSYAVDTACSSSLAGIHLACNALWRGEIDTAIAGGTNVLTNPDFTAGLDRGHFLSRTGNCKTFDDGADGYCRGEGIGTIILKRLDDAIADHDPILGVVLGAYTNHSAESESITRPHVGAQRAIFSKILNEASVDPFSISYVEMHGTGTQAGDAGEMSSVLEVFAPPPSQVVKVRKSDEPVYIGSVKPNVGHGEAASGVTALIKVLLMMQKNEIPPHCGIKTIINRKFPTDLKERNVHIALEPTTWPKSSDPSRPRRAFVNNFSAAGGNTALLIEDAPILPALPTATTSTRPHLIAVSAKNGASLQGNLKSLLRFLQENEDIPLGQISYTTTARRLHHQHRVMLHSSTVGEACSQIEAALRDGTGMKRPKSAPKPIFCFTGQGAQYPGMGKELWDNFSLFRSEMSQLDKMGQTLGFPSVMSVVQSDEKDISGFPPTVVQLANVCMQIALARLWASWNITPAAVLGHSLGEYAALNIAGVLSDVDTLYLTGRRAEILERKCARGTHAMLVVMASVEKIAALLKGEAYEIACINSPVETVLAGTVQRVAALKEMLTASGLKSTVLKVPYAFHSSQITPISDEYESAASSVTFSKTKIPVLCPLDGTIADGENHPFNARYLVRHALEPVRMMQTLLNAKNEGIINDRTVFIEVGPHPAIAGMINPVLGKQTACVASQSRGRSLWKTLEPALSTVYMLGANVSWGEYQRDFESTHKVIKLPAYSWDIKDYWMQYVNDWSLRKGDPAVVVSKEPMMSETNKLDSTTIHRVVEETGDAAQVRLIVEADIQRDDLSPLVQGHEVNNIPLCTPSVYADMALTLGKYLLDKYQPQTRHRLVDVSDMTISKALILRAGAAEQLLQAHADVDWKTMSAQVKFMSFNNKGKLQEHSRCTLVFKDGNLQEKLQKDLDKVQQKLKALRDGIAQGTTARFNTAMVYRAIRPLARFHNDYRAIDEIVLNSNTLEASSVLSYGAVKRGGHFHTHPAIIDSLTQSCGFTMNCNDSSDLDVDVFMNHGWGSFQIFEPIDFEKSYTTYTHMQAGQNNLWYGDVVVLDGHKVVAFFGKIAIQCVSRRVLKVILSMESGQKSNAQQASAVKAPQKVAPTRPVVTIPSSSQPSTKTSAPSALSNKFSTALNIIAEESGLSVDDLSDNTVFSDVGIDSLLGLTIAARLKEELDVDLEFNSFFYEFPTVKDLKHHFGNGPESADEMSSPDTPMSQSGWDDLSTPITVPSTPTGCADQPSQKVDFNKVLDIISEESGVAVEELTPDTNLGDSGVDSLLSLVIVSRLRDELDLDIQQESLFLDCPTVADLREVLTGRGSRVAAPKSISPASSASSNWTPAQPVVTMESKASPLTATDKDALEERERAVDACVKKYTAGWTPPTSAPYGAMPIKEEKVVLVTGASGSLGGHLVYHLAQLPDVKTVICLNRENKAEPFTRQLKAMRDKGIRYPENLKHKLKVYQTDYSRPNFGLDEKTYVSLWKTTTHLIHQAWPMSAKRAFSGFETQFQVLRNLADFATLAASQYPAGFKFSFQFVSSVGVVGHHRLGNEPTIVPEELVGIESVLPNGYSDAKWGCERMLAATMGKHRGFFRPMVVRLGQIAGSKTSGYWNPMEHFGFMMKSSQTLNAIPDVPGTVYWAPVNDIAATCSDLILSDREPFPVYHIENPHGIPWHHMTRVLAKAIGITDLIPFKEWVRRVAEAPQRNNPASTLLEFLDETYLRMACGGLVLGVDHTLEHSKTLRDLAPVNDEIVNKYVHIWKEIGFLANN